ncbi:MAG: hypothetical protein RI926_548 [Actinomycetota bacterium]|jgi:uncharacterized membrane protein YcgQ (UPF0703/DUF1980 family)
MFTKSRLALAAFFVAVLTLIPLSASASVPRISATPSSSSLAPAQSVAVNFVLDEPIVCSTNPCDVTLDFSSVLALGLTASTNSVNWTAADWAQTRTITFTLDPNTPATHPQAVNLSVAAQSNSEYYRAYRINLTINVVVPDIRPTASPTPDQLAVTGGNLWQGIALALISVTAGLGLYTTGVYLRRKRRS